MSGPERVYPRYAHEAVITLHTAGMKFEGRTTNVSRGGLCAELADDIPNGTEVDVDIQLVFEDEVHSEPLRVPARVVWCTSFDDAHQVGVAFKPLDADLGEYLTMFLRYLHDDTGAAGERERPSIDDRFR